MTRLAHLLLWLATLLAGCSLGFPSSPIETLDQALIGEVSRSCGPTDGPGLHFNLQSPDGQYEYDFSLWVSMPDTRTEYPLRGSGGNTYSGEFCTSGHCLEIAQMRITLDPNASGLVTGSILVAGGQDTRLQADYRAEFVSNPELLCG